MMRERKKLSDAIYSIAECQQGYFTANQAKVAGLQDNTHPYHVQNGDWVREWRGIYRLTRFPHQPESEYVLWSLWSRNRLGQVQGVFSHQTALGIFDLSDLMPAKLHMTVPKKFRRSSEIPKILVLHRGNVAAADQEERGGYSVTKPLKTLFDLLEEKNIPEEILREAGQEGIKRGLITKAEIKERSLNLKQQRFLLTLGKI